MAEEKKPKIDLKARLKKDVTPAPPPTSSGSAAAPSSPLMPSAPGSSGIPVPPGVPVGPPPATDPSNPLAVAAGMATSAPSMPQQPQRIEVDEAAVHEAAGKARRLGFVIAGIAAIVFTGVGYVAGGAQEQGAGRAQAHRDAQDLKKNIEGSKAKLENLAKALEEGQKALSAKQGERKFPVDLANQLGGIHVDFDGTQLAGRRFAGFSQETTSGLVDFITGIQTMEDHKNAIKNMLTRLAANKPFIEQFNAAGTQQQIQHVILLGGPTGRDPSGNYIGMISQLSAPITITPEKIEIPAELKATNPLGGGGAAISVNKYTGGNLDKPSAVYLLPRSYDTVCPAETKSAAAQLGVKLQDLIKEIRGEGQPAGDMVQDTKPGLLERADRLSKGLEKI
jgi:hypothetical protein